MYRGLTMTDVREVLRRWQAEQSIKSIARGTRIDRKDGAPLHRDGGANRNR